MKNSHILNALIVVLMFLAGCLPQPQVENYSTNTPMVTSTATLVATVATSVANIQATPSVPIVTATVPVPSFEKRCVNVTPNLSGVRLNGTMIFKNWKTLSLVLRRSGNQIRIPDQPGNSIGWAAVSPNNKYLMYEDPFGKLIVRTGDTSLYAQFDKKDVYKTASLLRTFQWLGNDFVRFSMTEGVDDEFIARALDIHSGNLQELRVDFPSLASGAQNNWGIDDPTERRPYLGVNVLYDPSLTRVLYPKVDGTIVLYDIENNIELAASQLGDIGVYPSWSPDGKFVVIKSKPRISQEKKGDELFIVSRDGSDFIRLTYLATVYAGDSIGSYSWSPDGKRIAFWMKSPDQEEYSLAIADINSGDVTNYCITGIAAYFDINLTPDSAFPTILGVSTGAPVWSPDGTKLLINQLDSNKKNINVLLVDLTQQTASPFTKNLEPIGWMSAEP
jgi:hypothetical protein